VKIANYGLLEVVDGASIIPGMRWNGRKGGVVALRTDVYQGFGTGKVSFHSNHMA
jgi:hypothetical protein